MLWKLWGQDRPICLLIHIQSRFSIRLCSEKKALWQAVSGAALLFTNRCHFTFQSSRFLNTELQLWNRWSPHQACVPSHLFLSYNLVPKSPHHSQILPAIHLCSYHSPSNAELSLPCQTRLKDWLWKIYCNIRFLIKLSNSSCNSFNESLMDL